MDMLLVEERSTEGKLNAFKDVCILPVEPSTAPWTLQLIVAYAFQRKMLLLYMQNFLLKLPLPSASYRQLQSFLCMKMERLHVTKDDF